MTRLTHCCFYPASSDRGMSVCGYFYSGAGGARFCSAGRKNRGGFMELCEIALTGLSLAMDAFAVSMCKGVEMKKFILKYAIVIALFFGIFQAAMPLIGWAVASTFEEYITAYDHWIAFGLLLLLGGKMIWDSFKKEEKEEQKPLNIGFKTLLLMALATSIDALAVGVTFAFLQVNVWLAVALIGCITFVLSLIGVAIGVKLGDKFEKKAEFVGGLILVLIGVKILLEHLGVISF